MSGIFSLGLLACIGLLILAMATEGRNRSTSDAIYKGVSFALIGLMVFLATIRIDP